jgi:hypothetical protein
MATKISARARLIAPSLLAAIFIAPALAAPPQFARPLRLFATGPRWLLPARPQIVKNGPRQPLARQGTHPEQFTIIDVPGAGTADGQGTILVGANSSLLASGFYVDPGNDSHGFVRASDGTISTFDVGGATSQTSVWWMNNRGDLAGDYDDPDTGILKCFLRTAGGTVEPFDASEAGTDSDVERIDNAGSIVGEYYDAIGAFHGYVRAKKGAITQFDAPDAGTGYLQGTEAFDVNRAGVISGPYYDANNVAHGYLRAADGTFTEFDVPGAGAGPNQGTIANIIDDKGTLAGTYIDSNDVLHGFLRAPDGAITTFDAPGAGTGYQQGTWPVDIADHGKIVGWYQDANSVYHGFERLKNGAIVEFDAPGAEPGQGPYFGPGTLAISVAKHNVIAGWEQDNSGVYHGYLRTR